MGKNVLKYGGKSGILPKLKPIFDKPIRAQNEYELAKERSIESGYAEGVPLPKIKGKKIFRTQPPKKFITVEERIKSIEYPSMSLKEMNELPPDERDAYRRQYYRAEFLKEAYLEEARRLKNIDELNEKVHQQALERAKKIEAEEQSEHDKSIHGLPTLQSILDNGLIRKRTPEENQLLKEKKTLNRRIDELEQKEAQAQKLLELYHAAAKFITTEEQLEEAIHKAFEIDVGVFEGNQATIEAKLADRSLGYLTAEANEATISDTILGQINGKPGLAQVKSALDGSREEAKRNAQLNVNK